MDSFKEEGSHFGQHIGPKVQASSLASLDRCMGLFFPGNIFQGLHLYANSINRQDRVEELSFLRIFDYN